MYHSGQGWKKGRGILMSEEAVNVWRRESLGDLWTCHSILL
jgi:hypothetical protein